MTTSLNIDIRQQLTDNACAIFVFNFFFHTLDLKPIDSLFKHYWMSMKFLLLSRMRARVVIRRSQVHGSGPAPFFG